MAFIFSDDNCHTLYNHEFHINRTDMKLVYCYFGTVVNKHDPKKEIRHERWDRNGISKTTVDYNLISHSQG